MRTTPYDDVLKRSDYWLAREGWATLRVLGDIYPDPGPMRPTPLEVINAVMERAYLKPIHDLFNHPSPLLKFLEG